MLYHAVFPFVSGCAKFPQDLSVAGTDFVQSCQDLDKY